MLSGPSLWFLSCLSAFCISNDRWNQLWNNIPAKVSQNESDCNMMSVQLIYYSLSGLQSDQLN